MPLLKAAALYFALLFALGWMLGPLRELLIVPHLGRLAGLMIEAPIMLIAMVFAARFVLRRYAIPPALKQRAAIGLIALALLLIAEFFGVVWVRRLSAAEYFGGFDRVSGTLVLLLYALFAAMPALVARGVDSRAPRR